MSEQGTSDCVDRSWMERCKPRFPCNGSWCEESREAFLHAIAENGSTDCITRDNDTQGG